MLRGTLNIVEIEIAIFLSSMRKAGSAMLLGLDAISIVLQPTVYLSIP